LAKHIVFLCRFRPAALLWQRETPGLSKKQPNPADFTIVACFLGKNRYPAEAGSVLQPVPPVLFCRHSALFSA